MSILRLFGAFQLDDFGSSVMDQRRRQNCSLTLAAALCEHALEVQSAELP